MDMHDSDTVIIKVCGRCACVLRGFHVSLPPMVLFALASHIYICVRFASQRDSSETHANPNRENQFHSRLFFIFRRVEGLV